MSSVVTRKKKVEDEANPFMERYLLDAMSDKEFGKRLCGSCNTWKLHLTVFHACTRAAIVLKRRRYSCGTKSWCCFE